MKRYALYIAVLALCAAPMSFAQFAGTGTTTLSVVVGPEAAISINTGITNLTTSGSTFGNAFTGTTNFSYKVRTTKSGGNGNITLEVTSDFGPSGGPSVAAPPNAGDALNYTCSLAGVGTACSGSTAASTSAATNVASFGADAKSATAGDSGSVGWSLTNDPAYATGTYTATVTFTISAA